MLIHSCLLKFETKNACLEQLKCKIVCKTNLVNSWFSQFVLSMRLQNGWIFTYLTRTITSLIDIANWVSDSNSSPFTHWSLHSVGYRVILIWSTAKGERNSVHLMLIKQTEVSLHLKAYSVALILCMQKCFCRAKVFSAK